MSTDQVVFDCKRQFHVLSFFRDVGEEYRYLLAEKCDYTGQMINQQLMSASSKFHPGFAQDPVELLNKVLPRVEKYLGNPSIWHDDKARFTIHFEKKRFPEGIGLDALFAIEKIPVGEREKIHVVKQKYYKKRLYYTREKILTWQLNLVLEDRKKPSVNIIHPGKPAPPYPDMLNMGCKDFMESAQFWRVHALMVSPD